MAPPPEALQPRPNWLGAGAMLVLGVTAAGFLSHAILEEEALAAAYLSTRGWQALVKVFGGELSIRSQALLTAVVPSGPVYGVVGGMTLATWIGGAWFLARRSTTPFGHLLATWAVRGWRWWLLAVAWSATWLASLIVGWAGLTVFLARTSPLWVALFVNLWMAEWFALRRESIPAPGVPDPALADRRAWRAVWAAVAVYTLVFTAMNWGLWANLQIPHGDSAMYEEHLWNVTHGKGFRSYLDQGLFLGEHIQVIHLFLLPLYVLWPSQLLMELCDSLIIALTAVPVYLIARRHTGSPRAAAYLAIATLLYFPLQYLDISIDFKTLRPSAFGVPLLLAAIDQMERRRWGGMTLFLALTLSVEEVFAIPVALVGLWLALSGSGADLRRTLPASAADAGSIGNVGRRNRLIGATICVLAGLYLLVAVKVAIPWFREGATVHYARYFTKFGETPGEILRNMLTQPGLVWGELINTSTCLYAMCLLAPLGFLPVLSPSRLAACLPMFLLLCLNELSRDPPGPFHHFHAPLLPLLLWSAAAGLERLARTGCASAPSRDAASLPVVEQPCWNTAVCGARFALGCALLSGVAYTLSPCGTRFWDPGRIVAARPTYWRSLYLPDARARAWTDVAPLIPPAAHVASTDFVHTRLTHCARSYDYSRYVRRVAGYEDRVPADTDYIVIDLQHPYSQSVVGAVQSADDVRELREEPGKWELLSPADNPYFVVLKRRPSID
jgi:uncharacterized membrane protein